ncbi:MAG: signal peptidase II [Deltaproteobacteria bacterium]|nr:signal peptidase II [Deltaproteobacteria bacterium]
MSRRSLLLALVFAAWFVGDLWTKHWADRSLAAGDHPVPFEVTDADAGRTVGEVAVERFGLEAGDPALQSITRLEPAITLTPDSRLYVQEGPLADVRGFYVFWRGLDSPPRRMVLGDRARITRWLRMAKPEMDPAALRAAVEAEVSGITVDDWLSESLRRLSDARLADTAARGLNPITPSTAGRVDPAAPAVPGTTYLLTDRQIDVAGDWFKLVYAENPGAAFGFLKGLPAGARDLVFLLLTLIVGAVIIVVLVRMAPEHRLVPIALTGILGGAAGNFVDRIRYGYVIDFIDMDLGFMHWPTYNVADIAISVGVVLLLLDMLFNKKSPLV